MFCVHTDRFYDAMNKIQELLKFNPYIYLVRIVLNEREFRTVNFMKYRMLYQIDIEDMSVNLIRIFYLLENYEDKII